MRIAVNTRFLLRDKMEGFGVYTHEILRRMVQAHPTDKFRCYYDRTANPSFRYGENATQIVLWPPARHPLLYHLWYQVRLKHDLMRNRPDVFFSPYGYMPKGLRLPTVLTVHDVAPRRYPQHITRAHRTYYLRNMPRFLEEARQIISVSEFSRREIIQFYQVPPEKISVVYNGVSSAFVPVSPSDQKAVRARLTGGRPYFLYVGAIHPRKNLVALVQAFDIFKHTTNNDVQLVIVGARSWKTAQVSQAIANAEYQDDIHQIGYAPDDALPTIVGSALAMCYVSLYEGFGMPVLEAMSCGVPVLTSSADSTGAALAEVAGGAAIEVDPVAEEDIAGGMARLADDPALRRQLSEAGLQRARQFSWDRAADETYTILARAARRTTGKS
ncbi:MAG: glycosyltransferase family 1 protein [Saprospiraceae bacterium]|nr:glycosyltransferase family 1 protein [Saprospiraceae bacterium]